MRAYKGWAKWVLVAVVGSGAWLLLDGGWSAATRAQLPSRWHDTGVFTPEHPSVMASVMDFLSIRREPVQPIAFTHKVHLANGLQCLTCHAGVDKGPEAVIPGVKLCMGCHMFIAADKPEIKKIAAYQARGEDIPWERVYDFSPTAHVRFNHAPHIRAEVACANCHGDMTQQTVARRMVNLTMGACLTCHQQRSAPTDCVTCHF